MSDLFAGDNAHAADDAAGLDAGTLQEAGFLTQPHMVAHENALAGVDPLAGVAAVDQMGIGVADPDVVRKKAVVTYEDMLLLGHDNVHEAGEAVVLSEIQDAVTVNGGGDPIAMAAGGEENDGIAAADLDRRIVQGHLLVAENDVVFCVVCKGDGAVHHLGQGTNEGVGLQFAERFRGSDHGGHGSYLLPIFSSCDKCNKLFTILQQFYTFFDRNDKAKGWCF